ncbi:MAG: carboxypeptidase-like regulatory domain-containing protein [Verrucomicrobia bacterium]|nr:carboxypeptidase-like regulatory domain-containing protein [Verrucomicrobiota bacterium]
MKQRRTLIIFILLILAVLSVALWLALRNPALKKEISGHSEPIKEGKSQLAAAKDNQGRLLPVNENATTESNEPDKQGLRKIMEAYLAPIIFYGKVIDETGMPIAGASIKLMANDKPMGNSSVYFKSSDDQGLFSLHDARGAALSMNISKEGYYSTDKSKGRFVYGGVRSRDDPVNPIAQSPAVFILRKMGETEPLLAVDRDVITPKSGQPVEISLRTGRAVGAGRGDIIVECWTNNAGLDPNKHEPYDWRMRLSVPGGGLFERIGEFNFVAPESGYQPALEVNISKSAEKWKGTTQGEYFIKTREGTFARLNFTMNTGGGHFVTIKSFLNPKVSSRNLEFDPAKVIKPAP